MPEMDSNFVAASPLPPITLRPVTSTKQPSRLVPAAKMQPYTGLTHRDRQLLYAELPNAKIEKLAKPLPLSGVGGKRTVDSVVHLNMWIPATLQGRAVLAKFRHLVYPINSLKARMLIGMDVIGHKGIVMDIPGRTATITGCLNVKVEMTVTDRDKERMN
ncbi:hypothetical protein LTR28_001412 [Elasticomyces elasticus]|nr:hypothetical protein LTR28_001412 [Elasticomyces elasticus]